MCSPSNIIIMISMVCFNDTLENLWKGRVINMAYEASWSNKDNLNDVEYIKLKKDGLDVIKTIVDKYSREGYSSITPEDMNRLKWAGVYEQKPRNGYFMLRVRINTGIVYVQQVEVLAGIAKDFGRGRANITTRGAIQFHWIQIEDLPEIFNRLEACGLSSFEACGDCPRTIVGNPLAGIDKDELIDTTNIVQEVNRFFLLNKDFSNLPRKFKISISSGINNPAHARINDLAFTPATKVINGNKICGFHVWVGGGLSANPMFAQRLDVFVKPDEILKVAVGVCTIFRDYGYREKRNHSRLKFLMADWGAERFKDKLVELIGHMESSGDDKLIDWNASYFYGVHPQRQENKSYIGIHVLLGEITAEELQQLGEIAKEYGDGSLRTTLSQNIIISGINNDKLPSLLRKDILKRFSPSPETFAGHMIACTGKEYCNLAIVETKQRAAHIIKYLKSNVQLDTPVRIHITGCPNSCGQKQIADISLQGALVKTEIGTEEGFTIWVGGSLKNEGRFAENLGYRVKSTEAHIVIEKILLFFKMRRQNEETFYDFVIRVGLDEVKKVLI